MQIDVKLLTGKAETWHQGGRMQILVKMLTGKADTLHLILVKMLTGKADTLHQGGRLHILVQMLTGKAVTLHSVLRLEGGMQLLRRLVRCRALWRCWHSSSGIVPRLANIRRQR